MRITFDPVADAAFVYLVSAIGPGEVAHTHMCDIELQNGAIIIAFDADERVLGIEILGASSLLPRAVLETAELPG